MHYSSLQFKLYHIKVKKEIHSKKNKLLLKINKNNKNIHFPFISKIHFSVFASVIPAPLRGSKTKVRRGFERTRGMLVRSRATNVMDPWKGGACPSFLLHPRKLHFLAQLPFHDLLFLRDFIRGRPIAF